MTHACHGGHNSAEKFLTNSGPLWPYNLEMVAPNQPLVQISHPLTAEHQQLTPANTSLLFDDCSGAPSQCIIYEQAEQSFVYDTLSNQVWGFSLGADSAAHQQLMKLLEPDIAAHSYRHLDEEPGLLQDSDLIDRALTRLNGIVSAEVARMTAEHIVANCQDLSAVILTEILRRRPAQLAYFQPADPPQLRKAVNRLAYAYSGSSMGLGLERQLADYFDQSLQQHRQQQLETQFVQATRQALDNYVAFHVADSLPEADPGDTKLVTVGARGLLVQLLEPLARTGWLADYQSLRQFISNHQPEPRLAEHPLLSIFYQAATESLTDFLAGWLQQPGNCSSAKFQQQLKLIKQYRHLFELNEDLFEVLLANGFPYRYNTQTVVAKPV